MSTPETASAEVFQIALRDRREAFTVTSFSGHEAAGELYRIIVHVTTEGSDEALATALLQAQATLLFLVDGAAVRALHGLVARVQSHGVMLGGRRALSLTIVPSLWKLKRRRTRRIFQAMTTLEIAAQLLGEWSVPSRLVVQRELPQRAYTVQYDETDLAFLTRLLAEEGLLYYFEHSLTPLDGQGETLVLADVPRDFSPIDGDATLHFQRDPGSQIHEDMVTWFVSQARARSTRALVRGYDFQRPDTPLGDEATTPESAGALDVIYEHEGSYEEDLPARPAQVRLDQQRVKARRIDGASFCRRLVPGYTFALVEHEDASLDRDFVVTRIDHEGYAPGTAPPGRAVYQNRFRCAPSDVALRPAHRPRKPHQVAESAVVVGPENQEIHTDESGRVKVQFPWDLEGKNDDRSSCWLRVAQAWAGAGWGMQFIPRVGMEVIVTFLGGDLDRPVVTGCVYNATHPPPFKLPDEKSRSGLRTSSTPGDVGSNELSFNDAAGGEQIYVHASRNYDEVVENDRTSRTGGSATSEVALGASDHVGGSASLDVLGQRSARIGEIDRLEVGGRSTTSVGGDYALEIQGDAATTVHRTHALEVRSNRSLIVGTPEDPAHSDHFVYGTASLAADDRLVLRAPKGILIECGESTIELTADKIVLRAPTIELTPSKTLSATTGGGPSLTMGEEVEILTKQLKIFTESGALERARREQRRGRHRGPRVSPRPDHGGRVLRRRGGDQARSQGSGRDGRGHEEIGAARLRAPRGGRRRRQPRGHPLREQAPADEIRPLALHLGAARAPDPQQPPRARRGLHLGAQARVGSAHQGSHEDPRRFLRKAGGVLALGVAHRPGRAEREGRRRSPQGGARRGQERLGRRLQGGQSPPQGSFGGAPPDHQDDCAGVRLDPGLGAQILDAQGVVSGQAGGQDRDGGSEPDRRRVLRWLTDATRPLSELRGARGVLAGAALDCRPRADAEPLSGRVRGRAFVV
jgi:type VI secretion system secreted protein VgrG